jgi:hypothetical protein
MQAPRKRKRAMPPAAADRIAPIHHGGLDRRSTAKRGRPSTSSSSPPPAASVPSASNRRAKPPGPVLLNSRCQIITDRDGRTGRECPFCLPGSQRVEHHRGRHRSKTSLSRYPIAGEQPQPQLERARSSDGPGHGGSRRRRRASAAAASIASPTAATPRAAVVATEPVEESAAAPAHVGAGGEVFLTWASAGADGGGTGGGSSGAAVRRSGRARARRRQLPGMVDITAKGISFAHPKGGCAAGRRLGPD